MDSIMRLGLVGLGEVALQHLRAYHSSTRVSVVCGADINFERAKDLADQYGFKPYDNYRKMIGDEALDIVCVLTPPSLHKEVVETAAQARCHVLCEKPIASNLEDAYAMRAAMANADRAFLFGSSYRYLPSMLRAKELIEEGKIGKPRLCTEAVVGGRGFENVRSVSKLHYPEGGPGGTPMGLVDHGVHMLDVFPWLLSTETSSVFGRGNISGARPEPEFAVLDLENGAMIQLLYDEATVSLNVPTDGGFTEGPGWNVSGFIEAGSWDPQPTTLSIFGESGALRIQPYANQLLLSNQDGLQMVPLPVLPTPNHFKAQIEHFCDAIQSGAPPEATIDDGIRSLAALEGVYQSARLGHKVSISDLTTHRLQDQSKLRG